jgi:arabinogalactan oligomer / maltooligosaccharide transport system permease protein
MTKEPIKAPRSSSALSGLIWNAAVIALAVWIVAWLIPTLISRYKPKPDGVQYFLKSILYPSSNGLLHGGLIALIGLGIAVAVIFATAYFGKLSGERAKLGRKVDYWLVFTDQLTHLFLWIVIAFTVYPLIYIVSASLDPKNNFVAADLGPASEPLLIRARILPSLEGKDLSNYGKLFEGVTIYPWQWAIALISLAGLVWLAGLWFATQRNGGIPSLAMRRQRPLATWVFVIALAAFFVLISPEQFDGFGKGSKFVLWLRNTFIISSLTGLLAVVLTTTAGYSIARLRFPGRFQILMFFVFVQMFPGFLGIIAITQLMFALNLTNTFPGLILAYSGGVVAFGTWMYKGFVESLPMSLEEAALVDGCTRWSAFTRIVLPLSGPMLVFIFLNQFVGTYSEFFLSNILLTGIDKWNIGVGLKSLSPAGFDPKDFGTFAAAAVLGSLPIVLLYYSFQQVFVSGGLAGGVKE